MIAVALTVAMVGLGSIASAVAEPISLRVSYAFAYRDNAYRQQVADEFMHLHPDIQIKLESNAPDCPALLQQTLRSAVTNDLPDVVASTCYPDMPTLAGRGIAVPLDQFIAGDKSWNDVGVPASALQTAQFGGKTVALPENISVEIVYYNMDLLHKARPDLKELPQTWDDILKLAQDVGRVEKGVMPIFFEYYPDSYNWSFNSLVYSFGGDVFDGNGKIAFNGDAGRHALDTLQQIGKSGMVDITSEQGRQAFQAGNVAIYVASSSLLNIFTGGAANKFELRAAPFPQSAPDGKLPSGGFGFVMTTKDPEKQKAAWAFMKFAVGPEAQTVMVTDTGFTPVNATAAGSPQFLGAFYKSRPNYLVPVEEMARIKSQNLYPGENGPKITTAIRDRLQSVVTLKRSPEEAMPDMVDAVTGLLPAK